MSSLFESILDLPTWLVLVCVFLFPALEASAFVGVVIPGEIGIILGGVYANQHGTPVWLVLMCAIAGAAIGDSIGYEVGKRWGDQILAKIPDRILSPDQMETAKSTLREQGPKAVFFGRFTALLRALIPGAAGMSGLHYRTFVKWNVLGGAIWASAYVLLGYLAGTQCKTVERYANWVGIALLLLVVFVIWKRYKSGRKE